MPHLAISLLGTFEVKLKGSPSAPFRTDKARALLAYLAVEANRPHLREALAAMLWPNRPADVAKTNLRQELCSLRHTLDDHESPNPHLLVTLHELQFNLESDYWLDVVEFLSLIQSYRSHHPNDRLLCHDCLAKIEAAIELYRGDFLSGFSLPDCPSFDWWQLNRQEYYHHSVLDALATIAKYFESQHDYTRMGTYAQKKIELEPWRESAHRQRMRALALGGHQVLALRQYEICRSILARELGVKPAAETTRLYRQIREGKLLPVFESLKRHTKQSSFMPAGDECLVPVAVLSDNYVSEQVNLDRALPIGVESRIPLHKQHIGSESIKITGYQLLRPDGTPVSEISSGEPLWIEIEYVAKQSVRAPIFALSISSPDGQVCFESNTETTIGCPQSLEGAGKALLKIARLELVAGRYNIDIGIYQAGRVYEYDYHRHVHTLTVLSLKGGKGALHPPHEWEFGG